jgi:HK97 family phage prohead protease
MTHALVSRADQSQPYGNVDYADPGYQSDGKKRYPLDSEPHVRAAWSYINQKDNAGFYTSAQLDKVKQRIQAAADKLGIQIGDNEPGRAAFLDLFSRWNDMHSPAGSPTGGQFAAGGSSGGSAAKPQAKKGHPAPAGHHQQAKGHQAKAPAHPGTPNLSYDPKTNRGTGYGTPGGDKRVRQFQEDANRLKLTDSQGKPLTLDGKLGPKTTAAVKKLQAALGVKQDGVVTPALLAQLHGLKALPPHRSASLLDVCTRDFGFEFDERSKGDGRTLEGYAAVFNKPARIRDIGGDFEEVIRPGAFTRSLQTRTPILQWDHGKDPRVGTVPIGSIEHLSEDSQGLHVRARLFDNQVVEPVRQAIEARAVKGMSFRFGVAKDGEQWTRRSGEIDLRDLTDLDTHELGPVAFPAYDHTSVSVRSMLAGLGPDEHRSLAREFAIYFNVPILRAQSEGDSDPAALAQAVDVALDEAIAAMPADGLSPDVQKALAFLTAADTAMDDLLAAMGVEDLPDPPARSRPNYLTGRSVERIDDGGEPGAEPEPSTTRTPHLRQRLDEGALRARGILK